MGWKCFCLCLRNKCTHTHKHPEMQTHTISLLLLLVGGSKTHPCKLPLLFLLLLPLLLTSPLPLFPLLIPLSHRTGSTYSTAPESREWGEKGYYDSEERKEREREKRRADRVLWERGMRAVKAFGVFIRLPKPRAPLPIRLVDTASHVNEMQSRETLTSLCQFVGPFLSSCADGFVLLSVCLPRNVTPFFPSITAPPPSTSDSSPLSLSLSLEDNDLPFFFFPVRAELCTSLMFSSKDLIHGGFFLFPGKLQWWLSICSFACVLLCLCACRSIYVPSRSLTLALRPLEVA